MTRVWNVNTGSGHAVRLDHGFWSGKALIQLDGEDIFRRGLKIFDTGFEHRFQVDGVPCIIRVLNRPFAFTYELWVDGKLQ
jgi:hypothetical protein